MPTTSFLENDKWQSFVYDLTASSIAEEDIGTNATGTDISQSVGTNERRVITNIFVAAAGSAAAQITIRPASGGESIFAWQVQANDDVNVGPLYLQGAQGDEPRIAITAVAGHVEVNITTKVIQVA